MSSSKPWAQRLTDDPRAALPLSLWLGLGLMIAIVWSRRFAGALTLALPAPIAIGSSMVIAVLAVAALVLWRESDRPSFPRADWWPDIAALTLPLLWMLAIGQGTSPFALGGLAAIWGLLLVAVGLVHVWMRDAGSATDPAASHPTASVLSPHPRLGGEGQGVGASASSDSPTSFALKKNDDPSEKTANPLRDRAGETTDAPRSLTADNGSRTKHDSATQWQQRLQDDAGEIIEGGAVVAFAAGQKEAILHLAFVPPLAVTPEIFGEAADGVELEIRPEAVHTFGARLSIRRRSGFERAASCEISFAAVPPGSGDASAA